MQLMDLIQNRYKTISVVGMAKNAGKTVTLNALIDEAMERQIRLGITSTGRDGEKQDIVTYTEKPRIYVDEGTLIATTEETLNASEANLEILEVTDIGTAMGRLVIAQAQRPGYVQIAGPSTNIQIKEIAEKLLCYGAQLVIVDGAIDRIAAASPSVTEATILSTGAVLSRDMNQVIERAVHQMQLFSLPRIEDEAIASMVGPILEGKEYCIIDCNYEIQPLEIKTALNSGRIIGEAITEDTVYVVIGGSLVTSTLKDILASTKHCKTVTFIVKDATRIFVEPRDWLYFRKVGIRIEVWEEIHTLAVTINPYAPQGYFFDPKDFLDKMRNFLQPTPVFDVMLGGEA